MSTKAVRSPSAAHLGVPRSSGGVNRMAAHAGAPQVFALDGAFPSADGILKKSKREGLFRSPEPIVARWNGKSFSSVNTMPDGACGAHAQYGRPAAGVLAYAGGQLELRQHLVSWLPATFAEMRGHPLVLQLLVEDLENMFWNELVVPALQNVVYTESNLFWQRMKSKKPDLIQEAETMYLQQKKAHAITDEKRAVYLTACNRVFTEDSKDVIQSIISIFEIDDFPLPMFKQLFQNFGQAT